MEKIKIKLTIQELSIINNVLSGVTNYNAIQSQQKFMKSLYIEVSQKLLKKAITKTNAIGKFTMSLKYFEVYALVDFISASVEALDSFEGFTYEKNVLRKTMNELNELMQ